MTSQYLYLLIDLLCLFLPLLVSLYSKVSFYQKWKELSLAILIPGIFFIVWDEVFTRLGIWGFNQDYISGWKFGSLPVEEIIFFLCIPYACLFTYFACRHLIGKSKFFSYHELLSYAIIMVLLIAGIYNIDKAYTSVTFLLLSFYLSYLTLKVRARYLGHFYISFGIILIPFFLVNSILTGLFIEKEIIWYNEEAILGIRLGTIPIEDIFYALLLLLMNVSVYEWLQSRTK